MSKTKMFDIKCNVEVTKETYEELSNGKGDDEDE